MVEVLKIQLIKKPPTPGIVNMYQEEVVVAVLLQLQLTLVYLVWVPILVGLFVSQLHIVG